MKKNNAKFTHHFLIFIFALVLRISDVFAEDENKIVEIRIEGLYRIDEESLKQRIKIKIGDALVPEIISEDIKRIFAMGTFDDIRVEKQQKKDGILLIYVVKERPAIGDIRLEGNDEIDEEEIFKVINIKPATIIDIEKVRDNVEKIKELYIDEGFYLVDISYRLEDREENLVDLIFVIIENAKVKVKEIRFYGNKHILSSELKDIMQTKEGGYFSWLTGSGAFKRELFEQDSQRLEFYYLTKGYINVKFDEPVVTLSRDGAYLYITIGVEEGDEYRVGEVDITGEELLVPKEELMKKLSLKKGDIFNAFNVQKDTVELSTFYKDMGYAFSTISNSHTPHPETKIVDFTYIIQKGEKAKFGRIEIKGNEGTRDWVIRRELKIYENELYNETLMQESAARVRRLGFFDDVKIHTKTGKGENTVDVTVEVKERQTGAFTVGAGFSSIENFLFQAQITKQNFMGRGQSLSLQAIFSSIRTMFSFSFDEPYFFDTNWTFSLELYDYLILYYDFTNDTKGGSISFGRRITDEFGFYLTYKVENTAVSSGGQRAQVAFPVKNLFKGGFASSLGGTLYWDSRDDRLLPTKGNYSSTSFEWAGREIGSEINFARFSLKVRQYFPFILDSVIKLSGTYGQIISLSKDRVSIFERYFAGGIFTVRGFERFSLGPKILVGASNDPATSLQEFIIGGTKQLIFNAELEFPIFSQVGIRGVLFIDAGNTFNEDETVNILKLRTGAGFGIRWWSPMGPLRFEWGFPLSPQPGEPPIVFEFTIGTF